jgi:hypothetical protein
MQKYAVYWPEGGAASQYSVFIGQKMVLSNLVFITNTPLTYTAISIKIVPDQSRKVEYERERLLGIANKFIHLLAIPSSLSRSYSTFPLSSGDNLN